MFGKLIGISGNKAEIALEDELDARRINTLANGKQPTVDLTIADGRHITPDQRKKIYALIGDYCEYTGFMSDKAKAFFKEMTQDTYNIEPFSLADCSVTTASNMITVMLAFFFYENIPFKTKLWDSLPDDFPRVMLCIRYKKCAICLKDHAYIDHVTAVGMGRNRNKIKHTGMYIEPLCRVHHTIRHAMGVKRFMERYHLKPIKVTPEIAKELHLGRITND